MTKVKGWKWRRIHARRRGLNRRQRYLDKKRAEKALGRTMTNTGYVLHHHSLTQLVICQDSAYHALLHHREAIDLWGGDPNTEDICWHCYEPHPLADFIKTEKETGMWWCLGHWCRTCINEWIAENPWALE